MNTYLDNVIWTNHALSRLEERKLPKNIALETFHYPDSTNPGKKTGTTELTKQVGKHTVTLIVKQSEKGEWIVLSAWVDPPYYGTMDYEKRQKYNQTMREWRKAGFWRKIWIEIRGLFKLQ